jgi:hypothetical protein
MDLRGRLDKQYVKNILALTPNTPFSREYVLRPIESGNDVIEEEI